MNKNELIANVTVAALLGVLAAGCAVPEGTDDPMALAAFSATERAWTEAGLEAPPAHCHLDRFKIIHATAEQYRDLCGDPAKSYGCSEDERIGGPLRGESRPLVIISPWWHPEPSIIVHELLHAFERCTYGRDPYHADDRVWQAAGGEDTVQGVAMAILREEGWL